jgi:hypothetical protein
MSNVSERLKTDTGSSFSERTFTQYVLSVLKVARFELSVITSTFQVKTFRNNAVLSVWMVVRKQYSNNGWPAST